MNRRQAVGVAVLALALAWQTSILTAQESVADGREAILAYLDGLRTLSGKYRQQDPDGEIVTGRFYIQRPDRFHFDEDAEDGNMIVSSGFWVAIIDKKSGSAPRYPVSSIPVGALLSDNPLEDDSFEILGVERVLSQLHMDVIQRGKPELGSLTLIFREKPLTLLGWIARDAQHHRTRVALQELDVNVEIDRDLFIIERYERDPAGAR